MATYSQQNLFGDDEHSHHREPDRPARQLSQEQIHLEARMY